MFSVTKQEFLVVQSDLRESGGTPAQFRYDIGGTRTFIKFVELASAYVPRFHNVTSSRNTLVVVHGWGAARSGDSDLKTVGTPQQTVVVTFPTGLWSTAELCAELQNQLNAAVGNYTVTYTDRVTIAHGSNAEFTVLPDARAGSSLIAAIESLVPGTAASMNLPGVHRLLGFDPSRLASTYQRGRWRLQIPVLKHVWGNEFPVVAPLPPSQYDISAIRMYIPELDSAQPKFQNLTTPASQVAFLEDLVPVATILLPDPGDLIHDFTNLVYTQYYRPVGQGVIVPRFMSVIWAYADLTFCEFQSEYSFILRVEAERVSRDPVEIVDAPSDPPVYTFVALYAVSYDQGYFEFQAYDPLQPFDVFVRVYPRGGAYPGTPTFTVLNFDNDSDSGPTLKFTLETLPDTQYDVRVDLVNQTEKSSALALETFTTPNPPGPTYALVSITAVQIEFDVWDPYGPVNVYYLEYTGSAPDYSTTVATGTLLTHANTAAGQGNVQLALSGTSDGIAIAVVNPRYSTQVFVVETIARPVYAFVSATGVSYQSVQFVIDVYDSSPPVDVYLKVYPASDATPTVEDVVASPSASTAEHPSSAPGSNLTYVFNGLLPDTDYRVFVVIDNELLGTRLAVDEPAIARTFLPPNPVYAKISTTFTNSSIQLVFDSYDLYPPFRVFAKLYTGPEPSLESTRFANDYEEIDRTNSVAGGPYSTVTFTGLASATTYSIKVYIVNDEYGTYVVANETLTTGSPAVYSFVSVAVVDHQSLTYTFNVYAPSPVDIRVKEYTTAVPDDATVRASPTFSALGHANTGPSDPDTAFTFTGLQPNTVYRFRVVIDNAGTSDLALSVDENAGWQTALPPPPVLEVPGSSQSVRAQTNSRLLGTSTLTTPWTFSAWVKLASTGTGHAVILDTDTGFRLALDSSSTAVVGTQSGVSTSLADLAWHHVVVTADGASSAYYEDSALVTTNVFAGGDIFEFTLADQYTA